MSRESGLDALHTGLETEMLTHFPGERLFTPSTKVWDSGTARANATRWTNMGYPRRSELWSLAADLLEELGR